MSYCYSSHIISYETFGIKTTLIWSLFKIHSLLYIRDFSPCVYAFMRRTTASDWAPTRKRDLLCKHLDISYCVNHRCAVMPLGEPAGFLPSQTLPQVRVFSTGEKDNHLVKPSISKKTCILTALNGTTIHLLHITPMFVPHICKKIKIKK